MNVTTRISHLKNCAVSINLARIVDSRNLELIEIVVGISNTHSNEISDLGTICAIKAIGPNITIHNRTNHEELDLSGPY